MAACGVHNRFLTRAADPPWPFNSVYIGGDANNTRCKSKLEGGGGREEGLLHTPCVPRSSSRSVMQEPNRPPEIAWSDCVKFDFNARNIPTHYVYLNAAYFLSLSLVFFFFFFLSKCINAFCNFVSRTRAFECNFFCSSCWIIISFTIGKRIELKLGTRLNINLRFFESRFLFVARIRRRYFRMLFFYSQVNTMLCTSIDFSYVPSNFVVIFKDSQVKCAGVKYKISIRINHDRFINYSINRELNLSHEFHSARKRLFP